MSLETLPALAQTVIALNSMKRDFLVPQRLLLTVPNGNDKPLIGIPSVTNGQPESVVAQMTNHSYQQLLTVLDVPKTYADMLIAQQPDLLNDNINKRLLHKPNENRKLRIYDPARAAMTAAPGYMPGAVTLRAIVSDKYRSIDNFDLVQAIAAILANQTRFKMVTSQLSDTNLYIKLIVPELERAVRNSKVADDIIAPMIVIKNSEVGAGRIAVLRGTYRKVCNNGAIRDTVFARNHTGKRATLGGGNDDSGFEIDFSDTTKALQDAAFWSELKETVEYAVTESSFNDIMQALEGMAGVELPQPQFAIEVVTKEHGLSKAEAEQVLSNLISGGDTSMYGLWNAVTALAHNTADDNRAIDFQRIGGDLMSADVRKFSKN